MRTSDNVDNLLQIQKAHDRELFVGGEFISFFVILNEARGAEAQSC